MNMTLTREINIHSFFYKNIFYKNIEADIFKNKPDAEILKRI